VQPALGVPDQEADAAEHLVVLLSDGAEEADSVVVPVADHPLES